MSKFLKDFLKCAIDPLWIVFGLFLIIHGDIHHHHDLFITIIGYAIIFQRLLSMNVWRVRK